MDTPAPPSAAHRPPHARSPRAADLERLLAEARNRLIDTGTRNRLVHTNRRAKRPVTLAILHPDPDLLFRLLVGDEATLRFRADPRVTARELTIVVDDEPHFDEVSPEEPPRAFGPNILQTRLGESGLQKRLLKFSRDAKTLEEEQGINILYLAIGFLRWYEDEKSDILGEAPLILVPVALHRDARRSTFDLKARQEDITLNLPLAERLASDFGIVLPPIPDDDGISVSAYLSSVEATIGARPRWTVDGAGVELGFFSFAKLLMFHDLAGAAWPNELILSHPLLCGLLQDGYAAEPPLFPDDTKIDERFKPADLVHVVDADASQTLVIETVRAGRNLVVQGPPGTGKSQTIANILAAAAHDGKTVLLIAEKMVALDVVHGRLKREGLGALCLELHSRAANKRLVAEELGRTLAGTVAEPEVAADAARLRSVRDRLNTLSSRLHAPIGTSGITPFGALGDLVRARGSGRPPASLEIAGAAAWSKDAYERLLASLTRLAAATAAAGPRNAHPWRGTQNLTLQPPDLDRLAGRLAQAPVAVESLAELARDCGRAIGVEAPATLAGAGRLATLLDQVATAPVAHGALLMHLQELSGADRARVREFVASGRSLLSARRATEVRLLPAALDADVAAVRSALARGAASFWSRLGRAYRRASTELGRGLCSRCRSQCRPGWN